MRITRIYPLIFLFCLHAAAFSFAADEKTDNEKPAVDWGDGTSTDYLGPESLIASPDGRTIYIACLDAQQILWFDVATEKVTRRVDVPAKPTGLALAGDGSRLYVTCAAPKSHLVTIDTASGKVFATMTVGHSACAPVLSPDGKTLYVCNRFDSNIAVIGLATGEITKHLPADREPIAAAITPDGRMLVVANHLPNTRTDMGFFGPVAPIIALIDTETHEQIEIKLPAGSNGIRDLCISDDGTRAYVTHLLANFERMTTQLEMGWMNVNSVSVIDLEKKEHKNTAGLDSLYQGAANPWGIQLSTDQKLVCVAHSGTHDLTVILRSKFEEMLTYMYSSPLVGYPPFDLNANTDPWLRVKLPGRGPRGITIIGDRAFMAMYFSDSLTVVDVTEDELTARAIPLGPKPKWTQERRGEFLFGDGMICYQNWQSCASCHPDARTDAINWDLLNDGGGNPKNTKSLLYAHRTPPVMAEAVRASAEVAVRAGMEHILFNIRPEEEAKAIDAYLKSLRPVPSPYLVEGKLSERALRGQKHFEDEKIGCYKCHPAPLYTDKRLHAVRTDDRYIFTNRLDTPTLVEVWRSAPYLHDGRYVTIKEMLTKGKHGQSRGGAEKLTEEQIDDLVEYVLSL